MLRLIKLEIKKFKLWNYWKAVLLCNSVFIAFLCMIYFIEVEEGFDVYKRFELIANLIGGMVRTTFTIFAAVLLVKLIIDEYKNKSMDVLFTYPIQRKKIISAKLIIVFTFTFTVTWTSTLFLEGLLLLIDSHFNILSEGVELRELSKHVWNVSMNSLLTAGISFIPLLFGMPRKSATATIVTSIIIAIILNSTNGDFTIFSIFAVSLSLGLLGIFGGYYSIQGLEKKDLV